ncbi:GntR family transcriptional regulator [Cupriavidus sp. USMAA2-4]|uniref:GntR family transcriptional regulator n=1 Tax=Cupriavidus malaysiensis TaxID=367825 RepID=A0ABM6F9B0_9BURK|nr:MULTISPECIES: FadR/GntR family transcriptional regulator [Cupriavidus]AOY95099.1 GntR family transcriptional regulator [Cupriavidus sp. USMAA2-4]AOZ02005.1 GntR family transcriptional regulator [Cupriavidus sp. USMAHM13]AOZ08262.1 GntR family transcriptional regulator [Cupriavidus malaysiensis]
MTGPLSTVANQAVSLIQQWVRDGVFPAGTLLPSQRELAVRLGISRASLREAISTLQGQGIVVSRPGKGVYVAEPGEAGTPPPWRFAATHSLIDIYQLRFALEGLTARLAAQAISAGEIAALRENAQAMQQAIEADAFDVASQLDYEFHALIVTVAGNQVIGEILRESAEMMRESQRLPYYRRGARTATFTEHGAIIEALAARQPDQAQQAMQRHIMLAARRAGVHFPTGDERDD